MKKESLTTKDRTELEQMLQAARTTLSQLRFDLADKKLRRTSDIPAARTRIARMMTALKKLS